MRNTILSIAILLGIFCLGVGVICVIGGVVLTSSAPTSISRDVPQVSGTVQSSTLPPTATFTPVASVTPGTPEVKIPGDGTPTATIPENGTPGTPTSTPKPVPPEIASQMDLIQQQVSQIRGLQPIAPVQRALLSTSELREKVTTDFFGEYTAEEARDDVRELAAMGLLEPGFDLYKLYIDLYSEQIAGYYDPKTKEMYVVQADGFKGAERMTYAHEYTHTLQDQTYDMRGKMNYNDDYCETHTEYCAAISALIEGDAMLSEYTWFYTYATQQDQQEVLNSASGYQSPVFDSAPAYLKQDFLFPYVQGQTFAQTHFTEGGFSAIDAVYRNPPVSTEQILHPEKYPDDKPVEVTIPDLLPTLGQGWRLVEQNVLGEWYTYLVLADGWKDQARQPSEKASQAAAGWGGDAYVLYWNDTSDQGAFVLRSQWETDQDTNEFWQLLQSYGASRWGNASSSQTNRLDWDDTPDGAVTLLRNNQTTLWVSGPRRNLVNQVVQLINP